MSVVELVTPGMLITDLQRGSAISFCAWIVLGLLIGLIGSKLVNKTGHGLVRDVLLSIFGAIVAGFLSNLLGESYTAGLDLYSLLVATVGAIVFLIAYHGMFRQRLPRCQVTTLVGTIRLERREGTKGQTSPATTRTFTSSG